jgi:hypothetical protein
LRAASIIETMVIDLNEAQVRTLEQVREVGKGTQLLALAGLADYQDR